MQTIILVILLLVALAMVGLILLQQSEGGALGIGGGGGSGGMGLMTGRSAANLLSKSTGVLAAIFMFLCLLLGILASHQQRPKSLADELSATPAVEKAVEVPATEAPATTPVVPTGE